VNHYSILSKYYLAEAQNIANGKPYFETFYVFNEHAAVYGPRAYPPGFPLVLAPLVAIRGLDIKSLLVLQTVLLAALGLLTFLFLKQRYPQPASLVLTLLIIYNPWTLAFKSELMSDIAFSFFLMLMFLIYKNGNNNKLHCLAFLAMLAGFLPLVRTVGWVFIVSVFIFSFWQVVLSLFKRGKHSKQQLISNILLIGLQVLVYFIFTLLIFPGGEEANGYYSLFTGREIGINSILSNISYYFGSLISVFSALNGPWAFMSVIVSSLAMVFFLTGLVATLRTRLGFAEILFFVYFAVIVVFPYQAAGFRFLLPVFPLIVWYMAAGVNIFIAGMGIKSEKALVFISLAILLTYLPGVVKESGNNEKVTDGPQMQESLDVFRFIREYTSPADTISFIRPRVLGLYTHRYSMGTRYQDTPEDIGKQFEKYHVGYVLIHKNFHDHNVAGYLLHICKSMELVFENNHFRLFRIIAY